MFLLFRTQPGRFPLTSSYLHARPLLTPPGLALRAAGHPSHYLVNTLFIGVTVFGWVMGLAYKAAMPDM